MLLIKSKPTTPSQRHRIKLNKFFLNKKFILKTLLTKLKKKSGKNNSGKITVFHKGGGHKQKYRKINQQYKNNVIGIVTTIEYDPYRTANISLIFDYININYFYILTPKYLKIGDIIKIGEFSNLKLGHRLTLDKISLGNFIYNVSLKPNIKSKGVISRAAGTYSVLIEKNLKYAKIKVSSNKIKLIPIKSYANLGIVSNEDQFLISLGKAGRSRWLNKRPTVRGVAMNPVDHPHGGGEGKTSGGRSSVSPWGKPAKT